VVQGGIVEVGLHDIRGSSQAGRDNTLSTADLGHGRVKKAVAQGRGGTYKGWGDVKGGEKGR